MNRKALQNGSMNLALQVLKAIWLAEGSGKVVGRMES